MGYLPTKKQKTLLKDIKVLDDEFTFKVIDLELCLYKKSNDGNFDVEVSGTAGRKKTCTIFLWNIENGYKYVKSVPNVLKTPETIVATVNSLFNGEIIV